MQLLVVDDHALFRESLCRVLAGLAQGSATLLQAGNADQALAQARANPGLDLILLDLGLPGMDGLDCLRALTEVAAEARVVVVSGRTEPTTIRQALDAGARGYIPKETPVQVMLSALQLILAGGTYLPEQLLGELGDTSADGARQLSPRQLEVLQMLQEGLLNKQVADQLGLSESTVKVHIRRIFTLLGVRNRVQAVNVARERGLL